MPEDDAGIGEAAPEGPPEYAKTLTGTGGCQGGFCCRWPAQQRGRGCEGCLRVGRGPRDGLAGGPTFRSDPDELVASLIRKAGDRVLWSLRLLEPMMPKRASSLTAQDLRVDPSV
jgi:hypothetical protein